MMAKVDFELISKDYKDAGRQKPKPSSRTQELTQYRYHKSTKPREIIRGFCPVQLELQEKLHGEINSKSTLAIIHPSYDFGGILHGDTSCICCLGGPCEHASAYGQAGSANFDPTANLQFPSSMVCVTISQ